MLLGTGAYHFSDVSPGVSAGANRHLQKWLQMWDLKVTRVTFLSFYWNVGSIIKGLEQFPGRTKSSRIEAKFSQYQVTVIAQLNLYMCLWERRIDEKM
jgi:hypothetical protein